MSAHIRKKNFHVSFKDLRICPNNPALEGFLIPNLSYVRKKTAKSLLRPCFAYICANNPALEDSVIKNHYQECMRMYAKIFHVSTKDLRIHAQIIQGWKTLLAKIIIRNFCACTQKSSTSLLRICVYAQKIQQMIIIQSSNNPIVDVLRPAQKLQVWNTYKPGFGETVWICGRCSHFVTNVEKSQICALAATNLYPPIHTYETYL